MKKTVKTCNTRTEGFKVGKLTHYHCMSKLYKEMADKGDQKNPWETLRVFSETCDEHKATC